MSPIGDELAVPVLIVGAGPTGVAAATMLAQRGVDALLIDRYPAVYPLPRAVHLDDGFTESCTGMGRRSFTAISRSRMGLVIVDNRLRVMARFDRTRPVGDHGWPQATSSINRNSRRCCERTSRGSQGRAFRVEPNSSATNRTSPGGQRAVRAVVRDLDTGARGPSSGRTRCSDVTGRTALFDN